MAQKRFSKRVTRKTQYKLTPKDAETIIRQDFTDSKGNKYYTILTICWKNTISQMILSIGRETEDE